MSSYRPASSGLIPNGLWAAVGVLVLAIAGWGVRSAFDNPNARAASVTASLPPAEALQQQLLKKNLNQPGDPVLGTLYQEINTRHFGGALPALPVLWEPRLAEVGQLAEHTYTLEGMFGHGGKASLILLNVDLQADRKALERALCHEMVHAYLFSTGDTTTNHGPAFQAVLQRLSMEGAFEGILASEDDKTRLRAWLDAESSRLDAERVEMDALRADIERARVEVEAALADLNTRVTAANEAGRGWPSESEIADVTVRRDTYNQRATDANERTARARADIDYFNQEVARYNLMLVYPDGLDERGLVQPKAPGRGL